jgi:hypothetical protein
MDLQTPQVHQATDSFDLVAPVWLPYTPAPTWRPRGLETAECAFPAGPGDPSGDPVRSDRGEVTQRGHPIRVDGLTWDVAHAVATIFPGARQTVDRSVT